MSSYMKIILILLLTPIYASEWINIANNIPAGEEMEILSGNTDETVLRFRLDGFRLHHVNTAGVEGVTVKIDGGVPILESGAPDLEKLTASLIIPDIDRMAVEIVDTEYEDYTDLDVIPSKGNFTRNIDPADVPYVFGPAYGRDEFYPGKLAELGSPYIMRDFRGQTVTVFPLQYNPVTRVLRVYTSVTVRVYSTGTPGENPLNRSRSLTTMNREFKNIYFRHFDNYRNVMNLRYDVLDEEGSMLIIAYGDFMDAMQPLVEWKNMRGLRTEMIDVAEIGSNASSIYQFVEDYYNQNDLAYLLLVGDIAQMPSMMVGGSASDPSYGFLEGNDAYPEVMVGRFSAETISHVETQVERIINYERFPMEGADWYHKGAGIGSSQGAGQGDEGEADWQHEDNIRAKLLDYTYTEVDQIYDPGASASDVTIALNDGRSIINYTGHGSSTSWGTTGFSNSNINDLENDNMLPFIWSVACVNGEFHTGTCFAETWMRATNNGNPAGAIGAFMSTINQSWAPPMDGQDEFNDILVELYDNNIKRTYGGLAANGCMHMNDNYGTSGENETLYWTLFGDPSLTVRTDTPTALTVNHDEVMVLGTTECPVNVPGMSEGTAAISLNGELLGTALIDDSGNAVINLDEPVLSPAELTLVVTGYNSMTYEGSIMVIVPEGPYVLMENMEISSDSNGNGEVDFGETVNMTIYAENVGVDDAVNVNATVTASDPYVEILNPALSFGDIPAGDIVPSQNLLSFHISNETPDGYSVVFHIGFSDGNVSWDGSFSVTVNAYCVTGDVNVDWEINVVDIVRTVNIIINLGDPPSENELCAADVDEDGNINILDVIQIINFIMNQNGGLRASVESVDFYRHGDSFLIRSSGGVTGVEIHVSGTVNVNPDTGLQTSWNQRDDETVILFYSLSGNTLPAGDVALFEIDPQSDLEVLSVLVADGNGDEVDVNFLTTPESFRLDQNYPNPFNPSTEIGFALPQDTNIQVVVYDILGREIITLAEGIYSSGYHQITWNGRDSQGSAVPSGIYFYHLSGDGVNLNGKMILMK